MFSMHECMIQAADSAFNPLSKAVYGSTFRRGPSSNDGMTFFVGANLTEPLIFSVIGQVTKLEVNEYGTVLLLGKPADSDVSTQFFWRQQISALEKVELEDIFVDKRLNQVRISLLPASFPPLVS
ncbi:hypothetical protein M378DRAFT_6962 [Amanita muscaria Koide BX008]|uniref:Uncharacterized protein n=1 Tax=Amanita muscaria (strain Koide BX008) TaxID=946122 RepID=A0A0C2TRY5_AMAMK|nr:hypothetical protein M378DRAFT_6962 [Amanita muscaria Koide BX008]